MREPVSALSIQWGFTALYTLAHAGSAVSNEAQAVQQLAEAVVRGVERSEALFGAKSKAISELWKVANECASPDWDGNGANAITGSVVFNAVAFIRAMPDRAPLPEFAPEPDGSISLDWIQSSTRLFSVSVGLRDRLPYAWLDGADRGHAVAAFDRARVPQRILEGIDAIMSHGSPTVGSF